MTSRTDDLRRFADFCFPLLVSHLWSSTLFLLLILLALLVMRRRLTAGARFSLALIGILKFAIPVALVEPVVRRLARDLFGSGSRGPLEFPLQVLGGPVGIGPSSPGQSLWPAAAVAVWLTAAAALILRFALTHHRLVSLSVRTALPPRPREIDALARARRRVRVRRGIDMARSPLPEAPAVLRVFRPLVVLPAGGCDHLTGDELESLLCHECAHVARHDNLIARIESVLCAVFWFHPLIWIARRITVIERERACDEVVAGSAGERETYLAALTKFCHAAIAPGLPGVSCMATANLKERMDHVMKYAVLKAQAPSSRRVTILAASALVLFTLAAAIGGSNRALAGESKKREEPYAIRMTAVRGGELITVQGTVSDNKTQQVISAPKLTLDASRTASAKTSGSGLEVLFEVRPDGDYRLAVDVTITRDGRPVQRNTVPVTLSESEAADGAANYTGKPISLDLKDADLRDVIGTFGKLTGLEMRMDESVQGKVTVSWHNVPWDQAFDSLLKENGLTYRREGSAITVSKK